MPWKSCLSILGLLAGVWICCLPCAAQKFRTRLASDSHNEGADNDDCETKDPSEPRSKEYMPALPAK